MYQRQTKFLSIPRVLAAFIGSILVNEKIRLRQAPHTYHVNLNELLDNDEHFLFDNPSFRKIISNLHNNHGHLVNVNFDLSDLVEEKPDKKGKVKD